MNFLGFGDEYSKISYIMKYSKNEIRQMKLITVLKLTEILGNPNID